MIELYKFKTFRPNVTRDFVRADLEIYGIDHFCNSYTGLVFLNADDIDAKKIKANDPRCAGKFSVFGHPNCVGDEGHCNIKAPQRFDPRRSHPLTKTFKRVIVTDALRSALEKSDELSIVILISDERGLKKPKATKHKKNESEQSDQLFKCVGMQIVTFV